MTELTYIWIGGIVVALALLALGAFIRGPIGPWVSTAYVGAYGLSSLTVAVVFVIDAAMRIWG